jgi:AraC family transcriptional regulator of adaptative response/methylated-DNA-[protein]-cysteine methyltransferase
MTELDPLAARAVAKACAANPVAILIPCHRIVRADGSLGGYRWGVDRKASLLQKEGRANDLFAR